MSQLDDRLEELKRKHEASVREAVQRWQSGQEGSSLLRGAARALTRVPHYFAADYIRGYETRAARDRSAIDQARLLMREIARQETKRDSERQADHGLSGPAFAGRGIRSKPEDSQILAAVQSGVLTMPLWGFSLRESVARTYGERFLFRIEGPFHGIHAWMITGDQADDAEVIASGIYSVEHETDETTTYVTLRETGRVPLVRVGGEYETNTLIPLDWGETWSSGVAPPGTRVRILRADANGGTEVEALETVKRLKAGEVFFCPEGNLQPAGEEPITGFPPEARDRE